MSIKQLTLDGKVLAQTPEEEKALINKVNASFLVQMVSVKDSYGEITKGKKYRVVFSSAASHVTEILNCIERECPEAVEAWINSKIRGV